MSQLKYYHILKGTEIFSFVIIKLFYLLCFMSVLYSELIILSIYSVCHIFPCVCPDIIVPRLYAFHCFTFLFYQRYIAEIYMDHLSPLMSVLLICFSNIWIIPHSLASINVRKYLVTDFIVLFQCVKSFVSFLST